MKKFFLKVWQWVKPWVLLFLFSIVLTLFYSIVYFCTDKLAEVIPFMTNRPLTWDDALFMFFAIAMTLSLIQEINIKLVDVD